MSEERERLLVSAIAGLMEAIVRLNSAMRPHESADLVLDDLEDVKDDLKKLVDGWGKP